MNVLHLSHHDGCHADFEYVARELGLAVESAKFDDGYNIGPARADRAWHRWRDRLHQADVVLVSDTAPVARTLLQHMDEFRGHLVVWVCNRFDYADMATNDCGFPDPAYYELMGWAARHPRVRFVAYTAFEHEYARGKGVEIGRRVIKPTGRGTVPNLSGAVPPTVVKHGTVFVPPRHNDTHLLDLAGRCERLGVPAYRGPYGGADDLRGFKAVVHIPYAWSNFALFEHVQRGIPVVVPHSRMLLRLARRPRFFWSPPFVRHLLHLAEWYAPEHHFVVHFRGWRDLRAKVVPRRLARARDEELAFAETHAEHTLAAWDRLFDEIRAGVRTGANP